MQSFGCGTTPQTLPRKRPSPGGPCTAAGTHRWRRRAPPGRTAAAERTAAAARENQHFKDGNAVEEFHKCCHSEYGRGFAPVSPPNLGPKIQHTNTTPVVSFSAGAVGGLEGEGPTPHLGQEGLGRAEAQRRGGRRWHQLDGGLRTRRHQSRHAVQQLPAGGGVGNAIIRETALQGFS